MPSRAPTQGSPSPFSPWQALKWHLCLGNIFEELQDVERKMWGCSISQHRCPAPTPAVDPALSPSVPSLGNW